MSDPDGLPDEVYDAWTMAEDEQADRAALEAQSEADMALRADLARVAGYDGGVSQPGKAVATGSILGTIHGPPAYEITNDDGAQWALRLMAQAQAELDRVAGAVQRERDRLKDYETRASAGPKITIAKMEQLLVDYRLKLEADNPKLPRTYKLPSGDITRSAGRAQVLVYDEPAFVEWAWDNDRAAVRASALVSGLRGKGSSYLTTYPEEVVKEQARRSPTGANTAIVTPDGEVVPGVEVYVPPDTLKAKPR